MKTFMFAATAVLLAACVAALYFLMRPNGPDNKPRELGKPGTPISVSLSIDSSDGSFRVIKAVVSCSIDLPEAVLSPIAFKGIELISPTQPVPFKIIAGAKFTTLFRIKLPPTGEGDFTAEASAVLPDGSRIAENASLAFVAGELVARGQKPDFRNVDPNRVQNVPAGR
ncbi:MAG: hypothetical protein WC712_01390 [Candidatus Brocadiia bacterium]